MEGHQVALVEWPAEADRLAALRAAGTPRLLLVDPGAPAPAVSDGLEDWLRLPAPPGDLRARADTLRRRARAVGPDLGSPAPELDADGILRVGSRSVAVPPVEARLLEALLARRGAVVTRPALLRAGWGDRSPGRNLLDVHILRLRRRLAAVGMHIRTVRSRGYLLELELGSDRRQEEVNLP